MNPAPDYSAAYVMLHTDALTACEGHGLTFTIGRGNEICVAAVKSLAPARGRPDAGGDHRQHGRLLAHITTGDSQLRWLGPEKGVIHLATAAVVNAVWDLWAKTEGKPVWKLLADMSPEELVRCIDFRFITDALTPDEALAILRRNAPSKAAREAGDAANRATRPTPPRPAGSATPKRSCAAWPAKAWPKAGRISSRRSAATSRKTSAAPRSCARRSAGTAS